jgi:MSHA biogenesis protein MshP
MIVSAYPWGRQGGFGMITAIVILVILAALAAAITSFGTAQHTTSAQDIMATKAWQAAKAGNEWGLYQAIKDQDWGAAGTKCSSGSQNRTLDLTTDPDVGFTVQVCCVLSSYDEGQDSGTPPGTPPTTHTAGFYTITAVACNAASCGTSGCGTPASGASPHYVERIRVVLAEQ